jgi:hypothetical protein
MTPDKDKALCEAFPHLYQDRHADMRDSAMHWGFPDDGWYDLIYRLSVKLEPLGVVATQVKEKLGTLRFYVSNVDQGVADEAYAAIAEAEKESAVTCERCGRGGRTRFNGWVRTLCDSCEEARNKA